MPTPRETLLAALHARLSALPVAPATGETEDIYILSVRILREQWEEVRFDRLDAIDVAEALARFDLIRRQTRSGELQAIEPHSAKLNTL